MSAGSSRVTISILTGFPALFGSLDTEGMIRVALDRGAARLRVVNLRDFTEDRHRSIDDTPYGGGPGMVLKVAPVVRALESLPAPEKEREVVLLSPKGQRLTQAFFDQRARGSDLVLICGRYKAVDERVRAYVDTELSLGDFVISGGELAAMIVVDGILRMIPGVLGDLDSALGDSFQSGLLDCAYYTRPEQFREAAVPQILLSGNHAAIARWRREDALRLTWERRPDLLASSVLTAADRAWLRQHGWRPERDCADREQR